LKRGIAIVGSTGSIGTQALDVIRSQSELLSAEVLIAHTNVELLTQQAIEFLPNVVVIIDESKYEILKNNLANTDVKVYTGIDAACDVLSMDSIDMVLTATVGISGLQPTIAAINANKTIALANKETLVVAGDYITRLAKEKGVNILPVDSEHSAIFQCLAGEFHNPIEKIILTASGGPFRGLATNDLKNITKTQALKHPNWSMGAKISIDSATLMNKGLECIEAKWLFNLKPEQIEVIVHPQSIVHSLVQFEDGSLKAQLGLPDMKLPIQYALTYPKRQVNKFERFSFLDYPNFSFESVDNAAFPCLQLALHALAKGGNMPCVLNAANEIAVAKFLNDEIGFLQIADMVESTLTNFQYIKNPNIDQLIETDKSVRVMLNT
jgi:1-deoxy-D-xylulose-5-phosphate reductoisomerase